MDITLYATSQVMELWNYGRLSLFVRDTIFCVYDTYLFNIFLYILIIQIKSLYFQTDRHSVP